MTRIEQTKHNLARRRYRRLSLVGLVVVLGAVVCVSVVGAAGSRSLVLQEGTSRILQFDRMVRVAVIEPLVADVVVSSLHELLVYGKEVGSTQIYVWDRGGRHQYNVSVTAAPYAQQLAATLKEVLGSQFRYEVINGRTLLVDGTVASEAELQRTATIIEGLANQAKVINLTAVEDADLTPAQRKAKALQRLLGGELDYLAWDGNTVLITGRASSYAALRQIDQIAQAASGAEVKISNLVTVDPDQVQLPVDKIAVAIGPEYNVWALRGETVVVEGVARNQPAKHRVDQLLAGFADVEIINLVTLSDMPEVPLQAHRDLLQVALGDGYQVRIVEGKALLVEGLVADDEQSAKISKIIELFEPQTKVVNLTSLADPGRRQVNVRAKIVEVNRGAMERLGVNWGQIQAGAFGDQPILFQVEGPNPNNVYRIGAQVDALVNDDLARVLSEPNLLVNDGEKASMLVGGEIPIPVPQSGAGVSTITIQYKKYGVELEIRPRILPGNEQIELYVAPSVSSLDYANALTMLGFNIPALRKREAYTTVTVASGQTLIIGGLVQRDQSYNISKIPILGDLPIIGELFKHKEFQEGKTELVILITPEIMQGGPSGIPNATEPEIVSPQGIISP